MAGLVILGLFILHMVFLSVFMRFVMKRMASIDIAHGKLIDDVYERHTQERNEWKLEIAQGRKEHLDALRQMSEASFTAMERQSVAIDGLRQFFATLISSRRNASRKGDSPSG